MRLDFFFFLRVHHIASKGRADAPHRGKEAKGDSPDAVCRGLGGSTEPFSVLQRGEIGAQNGVW